jgi:Fe-S-cluster containining protein
VAKGLRVFYDCKRCPAYCCSYPHIRVTKTDLRRLARHFGVSVEEVERRYTKAGDEPGKRVMRHQMDEHFGTVCRFLDREERRCTIYDARPRICRGYPGSRRCGYYDFLCAERHLQQDPDFVATTNNR